MHWKWNDSNENSWHLRSLFSLTVKPDFIIFMYLFIYLLTYLLFTSINCHILLRKMITLKKCKIDKDKLKYSQISQNTRV